MPPSPAPDVVAAVQHAIATMPISGSINDLSEHFFRALDEAGFVIAQVHTANVIQLRPRRAPQDLTPCDVDPSPETAA